MELTTVAWGFGLVEGPRTDQENNLFFSDAVDGGVFRREPDGHIETLISGRKSVGGLVLHRDGGLVITGHSVDHWHNGTTRTLLQIDGVFSFNDCHTDAAGNVIVGSLRSDPRDLKGQREPGECWRVAAGAPPVQLYGNVQLSNGIGFSPEGDTLYHSDSTGRSIISHRYDPDGQVSERRSLGAASFERGIPDGMCVDSDGNLWVAHVGGRRVVKLAPSGEELDEIAVPAKWVTSVAFGGPEMTDLYIVTADNLEVESRRGTIFRTVPGVNGLATPLATI